MNAAQDSIIQPHRVVNITQIQALRFWEKVDKCSSPNGCWLWTANKYLRGHGQFMLGRKCMTAHRVSWILLNGQVPDNLYVLHNCPNGDNPSCVNPAHLFLGTQADNIHDMDAKGRRNQRKGSKHWMAILTEDQVLNIRERYATERVFQKTLASEFKTSVSNISFIILRKRWKHI